MNLEYGIIKELDDKSVIWFEPITDTLDGFIIRDEDGFIIKMFPEDNSSTP